MDIRILNNREINFIRWDQSISNSVNSIVYAQTWYLDIVCPNWIALIGGNYEYLMPICRSSKFFISYVYQPFFTQQLGLFTPFIPDENIINQFIKEIHSRFMNINLNTLNKCSVEGITITKRKNYELDLISEYPYLYKRYSENTRRNIRKAARAGIQIIKAISIKGFIEFYQSEISLLAPELKAKDYLNLQRIIAHAIRQGKGVLYAAYSRENKLISASFFLKSPNRVILLANVTNEEGKKNRANFKLIDYFIKENSGIAVTLDFEGSMINGVARFYAGFGATATEYQQIRKNTLPKLIKLFKP